MELAKAAMKEDRKIRNRKQLRNCKRCVRILFRKKKSTIKTEDKKMKKAELDKKLYELADRIFC